MKLIDDMKFRKKVKEFNKIKVQFPLWNYRAHVEGFACWEDYCVFYKILTPEQVQEIHEFELVEGRVKYGNQPLFWNAWDWQDYLNDKDGLY